MENCVVLGLGSNREYEGKSPVFLLRRACRELSRYIRNMEVSSVYRSGAMYLTDQDDFYNMAVCGFYEGDAFSLLQEIHRTEAMLGRDRSREVRNGPRSIDIDIELFGKEEISTPDLTVPHERIGERAFVLKPLLEILNENADRYKNCSGSKGNQDFDSLLLHGISFARECLGRRQLQEQKIDFYLDRKDFLALD